MVVVAMVSVAANGAAQSAEAATKAAIAQVQVIDPRVHAVLALDPTALDQARAIDQSRKARGLLYGYAILLKDNIEADGPLATTAGSMALLDNVTHRDAPLVARLRKADAVILGKTNLSEWANIRSNASISGWSGVGGQTRNPYALDRDPCGSSSGSAVAVAAGEVKAAIGTETDGSITCPAAVNGVVGLKPTVGLVSRGRIVPISHSQDTAGPIAVDVATAARVLAAIAGSDPGDPATKDADAHISNYLAALKPDALKGARIGVLRFATGWSAGTDKVFEQALAVLKAQGATLVDITDLKDRDKMGDAEGLVLNTELKVDLNSYLATTPATVKTRTLADVIAFDAAHADRELALFGQELFVKAEATKGLADPAYKTARETSLRIAGRDGIDAMLEKDHLHGIGLPHCSAGVENRCGKRRPGRWLRRGWIGSGCRVSAPNCSDGDGDGASGRLVHHGTGVERSSSARLWVCVREGRQGECAAEVFAIDRRSSANCTSA